MRMRKTKGGALRAVSLGGNSLQSQINHRPHNSGMLMQMARKVVCVRRFRCIGHTFVTSEGREICRPGAWKPRVAAGFSTSVQQSSPLHQRMHETGRLSKRSSPPLSHVTSWQLPKSTNRRWRTSETVSLFSRTHSHKHTYI